VMSHAPALSTYSRDSEILAWDYPQINPQPLLCLHYHDHKE